MTIMVILDIRVQSEVVAQENGFAPMVTMGIKIVEGEFLNTRQGKRSISANDVCLSNYLDDKEQKL